MELHDQTAAAHELVAFIVLDGLSPSKCSVQNSECIGAARGNCLDRLDGQCATKSLALPPSCDPQGFAARESAPSPPGTSRRFAAVRRFGRDRSEADMPRASETGRSDENAPEPT